MLVLVCEDEPDIASVIVDLLAEEGHTSELTVSGAEALESLEAWTPDAVVLDLRLPDMDGQEVGKAVQEKSVPLIVISGYRIEDETVADLETPHVLQKPFDLQDLVQALAAVSKDCAA